VFLGGQQLVEEFFSSDNSQRLAILRKKDGTFSARSFQWWTGDWATKGNAFWIQGDLLSPAETLEDARQIAKKYMATKWGNNSSTEPLGAGDAGERSWRISGCVARRA